MVKMELIDKKETIRLLAKSRDSEPVHSDVSFGIKAGVDKAMIVISNFADVVEERKHGCWVTGENEDDGDFIIKCSICGKRAPTDGDYRYYLSNYCPYCGAVMDEEAQK